MWQRSAVALWALLALLPASSSQATITTFTASSTFFAALSGTPDTLDFDSLAPGTLLPTGSIESGIQFNYSIAGLTLKVVDTFDTTSGSNSLGLTGGDDAFLDGDEIDLMFSQPILALGMFFITSDPAVAGEIQIVTPEGTALGSGVSESILGDGGIAYFLGLTSMQKFSNASITFANDAQVNFAFNVDDITRVVPEPGTFSLFGIGLFGLALTKRQGRGN